MRRARPGQNTTEYLLLLCTMVMIFGLVGSFLTRYIPELTERLLGLILHAVFTLAMP